MAPSHDTALHEKHGQQNDINATNSPSSSTFGKRFHSLCISVALKKHRITTIGRQITAGTCNTISKRLYVGLL